MRVKNPAYTEIVGRETDLIRKKATGQPDLRPGIQWENRGNFSEISTVLA
jgi:hypothetical protein